MGDVASIGMTREASLSPALRAERFKAVIHAVEQFVADNPEMLEGEGDFVVVFGPRSKIKVV